MVHLIPRASVFAQARVKRENACLVQGREGEERRAEELHRSAKWRSFIISSTAASLLAFLFTTPAIYTHSHTHIYIYIPRNFNQLSFNGGVLEKKCEKAKKKKIFVSHSIVFIVEWMLKAKRRVKLQSKG